MSKDKITRKKALKKIGSIALGSTSLSSSAISQIPNRLFPNIITNRVSEKPNILWITAEGVPLKVLGCYGSNLIETPNIDRIANEGMQFQNSFCTNALCSPSLATLLTGTYSHINGMKTNPGAETGAQKPSFFDPSQETFPKIMRRHGYQTGIMGKWHLVSQPNKPANPGEAGFDKFVFKQGYGGRYYDPQGYLQNPSLGSTIIEKKVGKAT